MQNKHKNTKADAGKWLIYIFSYNRGEFLDNCISSIIKCCPNIEFKIIDDSSDDLPTKQILDKFASNVIDISSFSITPQEERLGGLYSNMNSAFEHARQHNKKFVIFIQDDMQFVRPVNESDLASVERTFNHFPECMQIQSCFLKEISKHLYMKHYHINRKQQVFERQSSEVDYFSDVGIFDVERFFKYMGHLSVGEKNNSNIAREKKLTLMQMSKPFMMWLPYPKSYTRQNTKLKTILIEALAGCGYYPYQIMDADQNAHFLAKDISRLPIAERELTSPGLEKYKTWSFSAGVVNLFARGGVRRWLAKLLWKL
jgi:glycosyltransferase involved in cell wall biosynthesis